MCFAVYVGALVWVGSEMAWSSFLQSEGTGTPWNPPIWPVKMAIPIAGLLLLLQGIANLVRELGIVPETRPRVAMSIELLSILFVVVFIAILLAGVPLAFSTGAVAVFFAWYPLFGEPGLTLIISRVFTSWARMSRFRAAVHLHGVHSRARGHRGRIYSSPSMSGPGRMRGGLAVAVIISCALMAAMVGVIGAEIVTMGVVALPAMLSRGYRKDPLALGRICAGAGDRRRSFRRASSLIL